MLKSPYQKIQEDNDSALTLIGVNYECFEALVMTLENYLTITKEEEEKNKKRVNKPGGGRPKKLSIAEGLCLCLFYLRQNVIFEVLGLNFGVSKTTANDTFHYWLNILEILLPASLYEQKKMEDEDWEEFRQELEKYCLLVDSTEQDIERPSDNEEQGKYYSGKKKHHTIKSSIISLPQAQDIIDITTGHYGPKSDISLFREQQKKFSDNQKFDGDKAYVGANNMTTPHKKPRNGELTEQQKEENKLFSSSRIFIEHLMRYIKITRITQGRFPLKLSCYERVFKVVCGLVRLRLGTYQLPLLQNE